MQKRTNPFATPIVKNEDEQPKIVQQKPIIEEEIYEVPVYDAPKPTRVVKKQTYQPVRRTEKEKFTSVMDPEIRRSIKIACAKRGILFAQYLEDACREKLRREGDL